MIFIIKKPILLISSLDGPLNPYTFFAIFSIFLIYSSGTPSVLFISAANRFLNLTKNDESVKELLRKKYNK
jgi:hypothetical protein